MFRLVLAVGSALNRTITVEIFDLCFYFMLHKKIHDRKTELLPREHCKIYFLFS
jgi:hypothetical protein